ncbi:MAG: hypothetical protein ACKVKM_14115, partial [Verrucomicrobiia bacterium]
ALPDADQTPEQLAGIAPGIPVQAQFARRLAAAGCQVVVPALINRSDTFSGDARVRFTNQTHREWIYRQAFQMGRHVIGYEVQKVLAVVDWFAAENTKQPTAAPIAVAGYHEGGLIAFYSAALDTRIQAAMVSGYFTERNRVWEEPIYRNVFGLLEQFGDAEIASLISPRSLVIEHSKIPNLDGPPKARQGRSSGAAPGILATPRTAKVLAEYERVKKLGAKGTQIALIIEDNNHAMGTFGTDRALESLLQFANVTPKPKWKTAKQPAKALQTAPPFTANKETFPSWWNTTNVYCASPSTNAPNHFGKNCRPPRPPNGTRNASRIGNNCGRKSSANSQPLIFLSTHAAEKFWRPRNGSPTKLCSMCGPMFLRGAIC